jgi:uncharacterized protein with PIN domain
MIGYPEEQRSRSFASHLEHGKGAAHPAHLRMAHFMRIEIGDSDTAILERF